MNRVFLNTFQKESLKSDMQEVILPKLLNEDTQSTFRVTKFLIDEEKSYFSNLKGGVYKYKIIWGGY